MSQNRDTERAELHKTIWRIANDLRARTQVNTLLIDGFSKIRIPVPPFDEQARIVSILDKFDALANDLSSGLPAETAARRRQYEHYRDRLLTFRKAA